MNTQQQDVTAFHEAFGHPAPAFPAEEITPFLATEFRNRAKWLREEADELDEAVEEGDLVKALDALIDSEWFAKGGFVVAGHDEDPYWANVVKSNMAKLDADGKPIIRPEDGKIMKPEGWQPPEPEHAAVLARVVHVARMESAARQFAWTLSTNPDAPASFGPGFTADDLVTVIDRARQITAEGLAEQLYRELESEVQSRGAA